jgi:hypothetical protein
MRTIPGKIAEVKLHLGEASALISCPANVVPAAGQYVLAVDQRMIQAVPLFLAEAWEGGFLAAPPSPESWQPGTQLSLFGPLGSGFQLPGDIQRLALVGLGATTARLLTLATSSQSDRLNITLFSDAPLSRLSPVLEAFPLHELPEAISWADFIAIDAPLGELVQLEQLFGNSFSSLSSLRGQVFVQTSMPCCGLGQCGVCALKVGRSWKLTCEDGPVFDLQDVLKGISS